MNHRRRTLSQLAAISLAAITPAWVNAQSKTLKIMVGYPAGGAVDVVARQVAEELRASGYNTIVETNQVQLGNWPLKPCWLPQAMATPCC